MNDAHAPFEWNDIYSGSAKDCTEPDRLVVDTVSAISPRGRALDVGCGGGGLVRVLARSGWEVTGIDIAKQAIAGARKALVSEGLAADLHVANAAQWRPAQSYDLITSCFALPNTQADQRRALAMMKDALAPKGTLVVKDFDASMHRIPAFASTHLPALTEITDALDGLDIVVAKVVDTPVHDHADGSHAGWTAAFVVACKRTCQRGLSIFSFFMRDASVDGLSPRSSAAPPAP